MKTFIKVEIDDNTFIELPIECVKELGRRELIQWALYDDCLKVNDELADI